MNRSALKEMRDLAERRTVYPPGTVRKRADGKSYQKQRDGSWVYYVEPGKKPAAKAAEPAKAEPKKEPEKPAEEPKKKGGRLRSALGHAWDTLKEPFVGAYHLATKKEARKAFKEKIGGAIKKEAAETKEMFGILKKALTPGKKVSKEERAKVMNQVADLTKVALIGTMYGHIAAEGIGELLATVASPAEEVVGALLDKPLRKITKKIFGHEHGILPSSFYSKEGDKHEWVENLEVRFAALGEGEMDEHELLDKIVDAVFDELANEGISDEDIEAALSKVPTDKALKWAQGAK